MIVLAGMGLEYLLSDRETRRIETYIVTAAGFCAITFFYFILKFKEMREGLAPLIHMGMFLTMLGLSIAAVTILIENKTRKAYVLLITVIILNAGTLQWYFSDLHFDLIQESKDANEKGRLAEVLNKDHIIKWSPMRQGAYTQKIKVANYNTFESVLDNYEESYWRPVERNLLVNKRYYELTQTSKEHPEYFGVNHSKLFLTDDYSVLPLAEVEDAMRDGWLDFVKNQKVFFAREDIFNTETQSGTAHAAGSALFSYNPATQQRQNIMQPVSDEFSGRHALTESNNVTTLGDWSVNNALNADKIDIDIGTRGTLTIDPGQKATHNWNNSLTAPFVYREFAGDFAIDTHITSNHSNENEFAGLLIRNPSGASVNENWVVIESGTSGNKSVNYIINTVDGVSSVSTSTPADDYLRVERFGETILVYSKHGADEPWTMRANFARPDLQNMLQVGLTAQADNEKDSFVARFDYFKGQASLHNALKNDANTVTVEKYNENQLTASVDSSRQAFLVYLQNYDKDWSAYVNGVKTPIYRVNYAFQAVRVPKGKSVVEFRYSSTYKYLLVFNLLAAFVSMGVMTTAFLRARPGEEDGNNTGKDKFNEVNNDTD